MSDIIQWVIVAAIVAAAIVFLVKRLKPSKNGCCCGGCPYAGSCPSAKENLAKCPTPERRAK